MHIFILWKKFQFFLSQTVYQIFILITKFQNIVLNQLSNSKCLGFENRILFELLLHSIQKEKN